MEWEMQSALFSTEINNLKAHDNCYYRNNFNIWLLFLLIVVLVNDEICCGVSFYISSKPRQLTAAMGLF